MSQSEPHGGWLLFCWLGLIHRPSTTDNNRSMVERWTEDLPMIDIAPWWEALAKVRNQPVNGEWKNIITSSTFQYPPLSLNVTLCWLMTQQNTDQCDQRYRTKTSQESLDPYPHHSVRDSNTRVWINPCTHAPSRVDCCDCARWDSMSQSEPHGSWLLFCWLGLFHRQSTTDNNRSMVERRTEDLPMIDIAPWWEALVNIRNQPVNGKWKNIITSRTSPYGPLTLNLSLWWLMMELHECEWIHTLMPPARVDCCNCFDDEMIYTKTAGCCVLRCDRNSTCMIHILQNIDRNNSIDA